MARWGRRSGRIGAWTRPPSGSCSTTCGRRGRARRRRRQLRRLPFADLGFARVDHHRALRQGMAEAVYGPGKTPDAVRGASWPSCSPGPAGARWCSPGPTPTRSPPALAANPGGTRRRGRQRRPPTVGSTVVWRPAPRGPSGSRWSPPAPPTCRWPTSAPPPSPPTASRPLRLTDVGRGRPAPPARRRRRAGRRRRRRRGRRHGGRAGQRGRRAHRRARWSPCPPASATAPRSKG